MAERPRRTVVLLLVAALAIGVALVVAALTGPDRGADQEFVTRSGTELRVGDEPFRFVGFNLYDAAATDAYSCSPSTRLDDDELDAAMASIRDSGGTVVRFWAYQTYTDAGTDWSGVDRVIAAARAHDLRVMPVLEDGPGNCSTGTAEVPLSATSGGQWYAAGYREPLGSAAISYREYAARITAHYRDETAIVAWTLVNEAETTDRDEAGDSVLVDFARDVGAVVHAADPHHLVTLGSQSNGAPGASGADFADVYALPAMDFAEAHDWGNYGADDEAMPGADADGDLPDVAECQPTDAQIACAFVLAADLDKPLVVGEVGITAEDDEARAQRAASVGAKAVAAFEAGASGYLVWQLNDVNTDGYGVLIASDDPVFGVLQRTAETWAVHPER